MSLSFLFLVALFTIHRASSLALAPRENDTPKPVIAAYYLWHETHGLELSNVSWDKYNTLIYSFATTTPSVHKVSLTNSNPALLPKFVDEARKHGVAAHAAFGGWNGGAWYSSDLSSTKNRTAFVNTVVDFAQKYKLDGIDFDWEYPNKQGVGFNTINPHDTSNFLLFLQELRAHPVGTKLTLSAAAPLTPWNDASGKPSKDVSGFVKVLDYISIMNYDVWGSWSTSVGPNSPLNDTCAAPANQQGSAVSAIKAWTEAGIPANKLVLGVASYGHSFSVAPSDAFASHSKHLTEYPKFNSSRQPLGNDDTVEFSGLVRDEFLSENGKHAHGIHYRYDDCSQTAYVYNKTSQVMVSFDDAKSFAAKGRFIKQTGLRGFAMWEAADDYHDILLDSIRHGAGYKCDK